jgi:hypothetical protein
MRWISRAYFAIVLGSPRAPGLYDGPHRVLATKAIERPERHELDLASAGIGQLGDALALVGALTAALVVDILADDLITRRLRRS